MNKPVYFEPNGFDLEKVVHYYGLERDEKMICPFHNDNRPSLHLNYDDGTFHCFACGVAGNAFNFVQLANDKISGLNQLMLYHAILNSDKVKKIKGKQNRNSKSKKEIVEDKVNDQEIAHDFYYGLKTINWFKVNDSSKEYMINRGFTSKALNLCKSKLTYTNENYPIIFPMFDNGEFKGYVCRATNDEVTNKYLYNKGFSRNVTIAGDYNNKTIVLVEGYLDMLKLKQFGIKNVGAILGWKITKDQIEKLNKKGVKTIISALDMDKPGNDGTEYLRNFFNVIRFVFPEGVNDPGDMNRKQFVKSYRETKRNYRRFINVNSKQD